MAKHATRNTSQKPKKRKTQSYARTPSKNKRSSRHSKGSNTGRNFLYWVAGIALACVLIGFIALSPHTKNVVDQLKGTPLPPVKTVDNTPTPPKKAAKPEVKTAPAANAQPQFDFYTMLPQMQVVVPDQTKGAAKNSTSTPSTTPAATKPSNATAPVTPAVTAATTSFYLLQVASFPRYQDADALKAKLSLLGFTATVQPLTVNGTTWNRVYVGPYTNLNDAQSAQQSLAQNKVKSIIIATPK